MDILTVHSLSALYKYINHKTFRKLTDWTNFVLLAAAVQIDTIVQLNVSILYAFYIPSGPESSATAAIAIIIKEMFLSLTCVVRNSATNMENQLLEINVAIP